MRIRIGRNATAIGLVAALSGGGVAWATATATVTKPEPDEVVRNLPVGVDGQLTANPMIANGVSVGRNVVTYSSSGTGPSALNTAAPAGTPERYIDTGQFPGAALPEGVTITEAQGLNTLARIVDNLASAGLEVDDVISMRVFLDNAPGTEVADFAGFNRAFRQFFANTDLRTGAVLNQPVGTGTPTPPVVVNSVRPSRTALEVGSLPVTGWLVEVEVVAAYPTE